MYMYVMGENGQTLHLRWFFHAAKNDQLFAGPVWSPKTDPAMWGRCHLLAEWYPANLKVPVVQGDFRVTMVTSGFHESWSRIPLEAAAQTNLRLG